LTNFQNLAKWKIKNSHQTWIFFFVSTFSLAPKLVILQFWNEWYTVKSLIFAGILFRVFVILCLCKSEICIFGRVVIENPLNIFIFAGFIFAIITPSRKRKPTW
jgi:hypothetical protein